MSVRPIKRQSAAQPTLEGAGVHLSRAFGFGDPTELDPFLLLDDFRNDEPDKYLKGFPWHPHRGIETITYILEGSVEHGDSLGNVGNLGAGDVQWMTAGSGIMHQEMPKGDAKGRMHGFQLWANLPSADKMCAPRYQDVTANDIPEVIEDDGSKARIICGDFWGQTGPVDGIAADPRYIDISIPPGLKRPSRWRLAAMLLLTSSLDQATSPMPQNPQACWLRRNLRARSILSATCQATAH
jgi:quercetin 2,3-dioxygenase